MDTRFSYLSVYWDHRGADAIMVFAALQFKKHGKSYLDSRKQAALLT